MTTLRPFFTYFGGKYRIAPKYPAPRHSVLVEPFAGSAGYALRYPDLKVRLIDKDPVIAGLWSWLIRATPNEIRSLPLDIEDVRNLSIHQEAKALIGFWLNKGTSAPCHKPAKWMRSGIRPKSYWGPEIRERIAVQVDRIRHWRSYCASYDAVPNGTATWFIDPPYTTMGHHYKEHAIDFTHLASWCQDRHGQVIVCEQDGATWLPFRSFVNAKALEGARGRKRSAEAIWVTETEST